MRSRAGPCGSCQVASPCRIASARATPATCSTIAPRARRGCRLLRASLARRAKYNSSQQAWMRLHEPTTTQACMRLASRHACVWMALPHYAWHCSRRMLPRAPPSSSCTAGRTGLRWPPVSVPRQRPCRRRRRTRLGRGHALRTELHRDPAASAVSTRPRMPPSPPPVAQGVILPDMTKDGEQEKKA